ncbi:MAG: hypothetical protein ICV79_04580 [Flavisolibacter sp.]|nr:hypothetical protein [Flavisolibacter sp.]
MGKPKPARDTAGKKSVFAIQYSKGDATPKGRLNWGHALNYSMNVEYGCCGFNVPSHDMINAFKTDNQDLPMFTTYNHQDVAQSGDYQTNTFNPFRSIVYVCTRYALTFIVFLF